MSEMYIANDNLETIMETGGAVYLGIGPQGPQGPQGEQGTPGAPGAPGAPGQNGITPTIGDNGNWYLGDTDTGKPSRGEQGTQGIQGVPGTNGTDGRNGADGYSPAVTITQITGGHTVKITDKQHPTGQTFDIMDGADGQDGSDAEVTEENIIAALGYTPADEDELDAKADKPVIKTVMDSLATVNTQYYLGTQSAVSIALPSNAAAGDQITAVWYNGATAATLSITGTVLDCDYAPSANSRSEINALWDGTYWAVVTNEQAVTS